MPNRRNATATDSKDEDLYPIRVRTMADQATDRLRNAIQRGSLAPGAVLVERDLADKLGMSRVPIREAIQRLAEEGLVKKTAHRTTIVYLPSPREIEEITSVRIVLEQLVVERLLQRMTTAVEDELTAIVNEMRPAVRQRNRRKLVELDAKFHAVTWRVADHTVLAEMIVNLRHRVTRLLFETFAVMPDKALSVTIDSHVRLMNVFKRGDEAEAKEEIRQHITSAKDRILSAYRATYDTAGADGHS